MIEEDKNKFWSRCQELGAKHLPGCRIYVDFHLDYGCRIGVAVETSDYKRHGVRGLAKDYLIVPPWWKFWEDPVLVKALSPEKAIAELAKWVIENG